MFSPTPLTSADGDQPSSITPCALDRLDPHNAVTCGQQSTTTAASQGGEGQSAPSRAPGSSHTGRNALEGKARPRGSTPLGSGHCPATSATLSPRKTLRERAGRIALSSSIDCTIVQANNANARRLGRSLPAGAESGAGKEWTAHGATKDALVNFEISSEGACFFLRVLAQA